ncbi:MAG TPA: plastocyanin/azurin family copper-binding protein [Candidatus Bathyarchaeia archaeon]|nr:plastocyanin/azurin family copper-binding protein [Candidatus Bathyarchaeia archaeon]
MQQRSALISVILAIAILATVTTALTTYTYLNRSNSSTLVTVVSIPKGSSIEPIGFSSQSFLAGSYTYPFNFTVTIGLNNTVEWINNDTVDHTVTAFAAPSGAQMFNSGLIHPGSTFTATLTISGIYKYTCAWHQWLAGQITVKPR